MSERSDQKILQHLDADESLLWSGAPKQGLMLRGFDALLISFIFFVVGFAVVWGTNLLTAYESILWKLWYIHFALICLYISVGRYWVDAWLRAGTFYGLTDKRVIVLSRLPWRAVRKLPLRLLPEITLQEEADRSGTVLFRKPNPGERWMLGLLWPGNGYYQTPSFELVQNARDVYGQVLEAQQAAASVW